VFVGGPGCTIARFLLTFGRMASVTVIVVSHIRFGGINVVSPWRGVMGPATSHVRCSIALVWGGCNCGAEIRRVAAMVFNSKLRYNTIWRTPLYVTIPQRSYLVYTDL